MLMLIKCHDNCQWPLLKTDEKFQVKIHNNRVKNYASKKGERHILKEMTDTSDQRVRALWHTSHPDLTHT